MQSCCNRSVFALINLLPWFSWIAHFVLWFTLGVLWSSSPFMFHFKPHVFLLIALFYMLHAPFGRNTKLLTMWLFGFCIDLFAYLPLGGHSALFVTLAWIMLEYACENKLRSLLSQSIFIVCVSLLYQVILYMVHTQFMTWSTGFSAMVMNLVLWHVFGRRYSKSVALGFKV